MIEFLTDNPGAWVPIIFFARILDVSLGTVRTILVVRGHSYRAAMIGLVEVMIWVSAAGQVLQHLDRWYLIVAYGAGFSAGNIVGIWLERKMAIGLELIRAVSSATDLSLADALRPQHHSVVQLHGTGESGTPVEIVFIVERRRKVAALLRQIEAVDPYAFCTISDIKSHNVLTPEMVPLNGFNSVIKKK